MATTKLMTADDLIRMEDDGFQYELIRGELIRMSPAGGAHSWIGVEMARHLGNYVVPRGLGEVFGADGGYLFAIDPDTVRAPDASFFRSERLPSPVEMDGYIRVVPDLVVEVVSPSDRRSDVDEKISFYLAEGVPLIWRVEPKRRAVVVYRAERAPIEIDESGDLDGEDIIPGFRLPVALLFRLLKRPS